MLKQFNLIKECRVLDRMALYFMLNIISWIFCAPTYMRGYVWLPEFILWCKIPYTYLRGYVLVYLFFMLTRPHQIFMHILVWENVHDATNIIITFCPFDALTESGQLIHITFYLFLFILLTTFAQSYSMTACSCIIFWARVAVSVNLPQSDNNIWFP